MIESIFDGVHMDMENIWVALCGKANDGTLFSSKSWQNVERASQNIVHHPINCEQLNYCSHAA
jgi:hypothetical protein